MNSLFNTLRGFRAAKFKTWLFTQIVLGVLFLPLMWVPVVDAELVQIGVANNAIGNLLVIRVDGIQEQLEGKGDLALFEGDQLKTDVSSQARIELNNGILVALNETTTLTLLSRWEKAMGITPIIRLKQGELLVKTGGGWKPLEIETPVATAAVKGTEFNLKVLEDGQTTLTVIEGIVEFGTAFGTCPIRTSTISYGNRGKKCTKPEPTDVSPTIEWAQAILQ
jgi:hypothetical protein